MTETSLLSIRGLSVRYETERGSVSAIKDLSLDLREGEALGLIGESGCGKSSLSYAILDYLAPNARRSGSILFKGEDLAAVGERGMEKVRGNRIAMVFQNPYSALNPSLTIGFQLDEVSAIHQGLPRAAARRASIEALRELSLGDAEGIVRRYPHQVSGGIQQRICIAMALLCRPDLMILDEPTTALDVTTEAVILDSIGALKTRYGMSLIYISHDIGIVNKVSDRIAVMYRGEIVESGPQEELFARPRHPYTRALINCMPRAGVKKENTRLNTIPGYVTGRGPDEQGCPFLARCEKRRPGCEEGYRWRDLGGGHFASCDRAYAEDASAPAGQDPALGGSLPLAPGRRGAPLGEGEVLLRLRGLSKVYRHRKRPLRALNGVDLEVEGNDVLGVVGESGCGKSTMGHIVSGLVEASEGEADFLGKDILKGWSRRDPETLRDIQLIFQNPGRSLNPAFTVGQILDRPMKKMLGIRSRRERKRRILELLARVDLGAEYYEARTTRLSGGEKQRVAVARAFIPSPRLIVCDEPTSALDVSVQASVLNLLSDLQETSGASYLFISHDLHVVNFLCDHILVMYLGRVCEFGKRDEVMAPPYHPYTEALLSAVPEVDPSRPRSRVRLEGAPPDPSQPLEGCPFAGRCHKRVPGLCDRVEPPLRRLSPTHYLHCHLEPEALGGEARLS